jgi:hypothetical protein
LESSQPMKVWLAAVELERLALVTGLMSIGR